MTVFVFASPGRSQTIERVPITSDKNKPLQAPTKTTTLDKSRKTSNPVKTTSRADPEPKLNRTAKRMRLWGYSRTRYDLFQLIWITMEEGRWRAFFLSILDFQGFYEHQTKSDRDDIILPTNQGMPALFADVFNHSTSIGHTDW